MSETDGTREESLDACKKRCIEEWDGVNDPPCHPSDKDWMPCALCADKPPANAKQDQFERVPFDDVLQVIQQARSGDWTWLQNAKCKYIELRIDMRDGGCIIKDRNGNPIGIEAMRHQYGSHPLGLPWDHFKKCE